ncbi:MAG: hypothetical protein A2032_04190 [Chloroflexi bacterium RBG_19FT_COMBO_49_13]|nr:MAG: hypothetical protein A2Y53_01310 [Chloroflexi bacterium RBG_16_47_49]OGO61051.1 MAG: hypothetical protein A2032_04190 [Chloroflexi bacterium RBG_19FT_COMBO_49_13]
MKSMRFSLIFILLILASLACFSTSAQSTPSNILFSDDFSNTDNKWDQVTESTRSSDYYNNAYRITVNDTNSDAWANPGSESFTDVQIEVDATKNSGPDDNDFGIICRYTDVDQFYYGVVSSDGYYGIMKMTSDGGMPIGSDSLLESDKIIQGDASNHIRFDCVGSTLTLYVNSTQVDQQTDSTYTTGNVGLIAGTFDTAGTDVLFDNLFVYKP